LTLYYFGPCARITHDVFEMRGANHGLFPIRDLALIHIIRAPRGQATRSRLALAGSAALILAATAVAAAASGLIASPVWAAVGILLCATSCAVVAGYWRNGEKPFELRATYRGRLVCLLKTSDKRMLGQVRRGLLRAVESIEFAR
jgi:hypothetical protein